MLPPRSLSLLICALPVLVWAEEKPYGLEAAQGQMKDFTVAPGLQATLFAAEPQIQNPTNIDIDPRGRVWAAEAVNYRATAPWICGRRATGW